MTRALRTRVTRKFTDQYWEMRNAFLFNSGGAKSKAYIKCIYKFYCHFTTVAHTLCSISNIYNRNAQHGAKLLENIVLMAQEMVCKTQGKQFILFFYLGETHSFLHSAVTGK